MKRILSLLLLMTLAVSLFACTENGKTYGKAEGTTEYHTEGLNISLPKYLVKKDDGVSLLCVEYLPENVEYSVLRETPEQVAERGFSPDVSAFDFGTVMIAQLGLNDINAEMTGKYETLLPTADGENAYFDFGDFDPENEEIHLYKQVYIRRSADGSMWMFYGICGEEYMDTYSSLFQNWSASAAFTED